MTADDVLTPVAETRLRAALDAAATTASVPPAWEAIRARVEDDEVGVPTGAGRPTRTRVLALAAAVLALLAVGAVVVATRPDGSTVVTDETTTPPAPAATGWYVPVDLPTGWVVDEITAMRGPTEPCPDGSAPGPVDGVVWIAGERRARISLQGWGCPPSTDDVPSMIPRTDVDLGGGVIGDMLQIDPSLDPELTIRWTDDGRSWTMDGAGIPVEELIDAARGAVADGALETTPAGFTEADRWTAAGGAATEVGVILTAPSGTRMAVRLNLPGHGIARSVIDPEPYSVPGQDLPVARTWQPDAGWYAMKVSGAWPGADMDVMVLVEVEPAPGSAEEQTQAAEVDDLVAHLRPATTEQWRALLAEVDHTPVLAEAETFADLADLDVPPLPTPTEGGSGTTTTTLPG